MKLFAKLKQKGEMDKRNVLNVDEMLTEFQRQKKERDENIVRDFEEMWDIAKGLGQKKHRVFVALGNRYHLTATQVRNVVMGSAKAEP